MTEEVKQEVVEPQEQVAQPSEIETRAMEMGWRPKEEFGGSEDDFIDAKEFVRRKPLFEKIDAQSRQLKNVTQGLEALKNHYSKVRETEFNRALQELKSQRKQAMTEGDGDRFEQIDEQIKDVEVQAAEMKQIQSRPLVREEVVNPEFQSWKARNSWYDSTESMRAVADKIGIRLHSEGVPAAEVLKRVEQEVRKEFPQKFVNPNKAGAPSVESSTTRGGGTSKRDDFQMSEQEEKAMKSLTRITGKDGKPFMTQAQYIADLKKAKGL